MLFRDSTMCQILAKSTTLCNHISNISIIISIRYVKYLQYTVLPSPLIPVFTDTSFLQVNFYSSHYTAIFILLLEPKMYLRNWFYLWSTFSKLARTHTPALWSRFTKLHKRHLGFPVVSESSLGVAGLFINLSPSEFSVLLLGLHISSQSIYSS